ncbi:MAG: HlyD family efflux transporter periplasmic adaptor subunit [Symbiobacteriaceae bacterium]|nr:HlyD family efflux transporter periplasmic adaptor subunit [Symbiobacteriaceae bacterium]
MKDKSKLILGLGALLAAAAVILWYLWQPLVVEAVTVIPKDARAFLTEHGHVEVSQDYYLYPEVSARILQTYFSKDDRVKAGDLLVTLDASTLQTEILRRQAQIHSYQAQIAIARQNETDAKEEYATALLRLREELNSVEGQRKNADARRGEVPSLDERIRLLELSIEQQELQYAYLSSRLEDLLALKELGAVPLIEIANLEQEMAVLDNVLASLQEQLRARQVDRDKTATDEGKLALSEEADQEYFDALSNSIATQIAAFEDKLLKNSSQGMVNYYNALIEGEVAGLEGLDPDKYLIYAPISGILWDFPAQRQSQLSPQTPAAIIRPGSDGSDLTVITYVSTRDISTLAIGQQVTLIRKLRDGDFLFAGTISDIATRAEVHLSALGIEERRVKISIAPDPEAKDLYEGYDLDVRFTLVEQKDKLLVPSSAVFKSNGNDYIFIIVENTATMVPVTTGIKTNNEIVLEDGIQAGVVVIRDPNIEGLKQGSRVRAE